MSVFLRLFAAIALVFLLTGLGGATIGYFDARDRIAAEMNAAMIVGKASAERAVRALASSFRPAEHITEFVSLFDGDPRLKAKLVGGGGTVLKESSLLPSKRDVPDWFVTLLTPPATAQSFALPGPLSGYANLTIETDARSAIDAVWSSALAALATLLLFLALVLSLIALVVWHALRPVKPLLAAFERLGTSDETAQLTPFGPPEFKRLYTGFNDMTGRLKATERRNAALSQQIATIQEEERADLARDLHDEIGPQLFAIDVDAAAIRSIVGKQRDARSRDIFARAVAISSGAVTIKQHVRALLSRLRPNIAADIGLEQALLDLVAGEQERHPSVRFEEVLSGDCTEPVMSAALYAVAREAIHNALHHGSPSRVRLRLEEARQGGVQLSIENDGGGMKPLRAGSQGLRNMRERIEALGGKFSIEETDNPAGVRVSALVPSVGKKMASV